MNNFDSNKHLKLARRQILLAAFYAGRKIKAIATGRQFALAAIVAAVSCATVAAVLTPSSGIVSSPVLARASFADPTDLKFKIKGQSQEVIQVNNAQETVIQQVVIAPGGHTGWHSHPGPVVVLIKSGQMSSTIARIPPVRFAPIRLAKPLSTAARVTCTSPATKEA